MSSLPIAARNDSAAYLTLKPRNSNLRILWLKTELLHPVDKGGKIRTYNMLKELKRDHYITYVALDDGSAGIEAHERAQDYCHDLVSVPYHQRDKFSPGFYAELLLNLASRFPYAIKKYESASMRREIIERANGGTVDVVICDFLAPAINVPRGLSCPAILFQHNVEAMIWKRHFEVQSNLLKKSYLRRQWRKVERFEKEMCQRFDSVIAVSSEDRNQMREEYSIKAVSDVPTGVDTDFFTPSGKEDIEPHNVVFTGSMDWLPNEDAIRYYIDKILPIIRRSIPDATLTVVGRNSYPGLLELSKKDPSIVVTGRVEDVRPYMERAAAYVVPLRIGGGTRLKIFEAMAMEKAIVSTSVGAEGLPVTGGKELRIADTPETFAAAVVDLLMNPQLAKKVGQQAAQLVRERFGWNKVGKRFAEICEATIRDHRRSEVANPVDVKPHEQPAV
jgi:glycosyltransferase involved in cell wall biosynthesis